MKSEFVVIDQEGNASFNAKKEAPEAFAKFPTADKRAHELADSEPGQTIGIYRLVATVVADVVPAKTNMRKKLP